MRTFGLRRIAVAALATVGLATSMAATPEPARAVSAGFDHTIYWNNVLLKAYRQAGGPPTTLSRAGAMMHLAMYDTKVSLGGQGKPYLATVPKQPTYSYDLDMNLDEAAYDVLKVVFPTIDFTQDYNNSRSIPPRGEPGPDGWSVSVGQTAAQNMLNARASDGSTNSTPYSISYTAGQWQPTGSGSAASPNWGLVQPFGLTSGSQFRPSLPGGFTTITGMLTSSTYANQVNDVKRYGSATATTADRTADQTQLAWFWANDLDGTYKPPGQLYTLTQIIAKARTGTDTTRLFALVSLAMADAAIAAWDAKYQTSIDLWRPETAIHEPQSDNNTATVPDPNWQPLSADRSGVHFSPPFPAYVSGHATFAGAWAGIVKRFYGTDAISFTATTEDPHASGVTRSFSSVSAAATEDANSRLYLGVHYQWDADQGLATGDSVANYLFTKYYVN
ncbi:vanadium-dependent haloperoxidase [Micromonospora sp. NPDC005806]|uniref:vanadium-dependent haloperoxidase n=1 Tax=Micromonospora sp. NPDC005806 TaxID=3364234 RepID=UPI003694E73E